MDNRYGENGSNKFTAFALLAISLAVALFLIMVFLSNRIKDNKPASQGDIATTTDEVSAPATDIETEQPDESLGGPASQGGQETPIIPEETPIEETPIQHGR